MANEVKSTCCYCGVGCGLLMGLIGGFLPATRAARMNIVDALRAV